MGRGVRRLVRVDLRVPAVSDPCSYLHYSVEGEMEMTIEERLLRLESDVSKLVEMNVRYGELIIGFAREDIELSERVAKMERALTEDHSIFGSFGEGND